MIMKRVALALFFTFTVNGHESSLAGVLQSPFEHQLTTAQSDSGQESPLAILVGYRTPADVRHVQAGPHIGVYLYKVSSDDTPPSPSVTTSIRVDSPESQTQELDKERERLEQLLEQLNAKEKELTILREKTVVTTNLLNIEKTRAEALTAQLNQKEQELSGLCTQRDTHQQMSQELNRTKSSLDQTKQQLNDIERQFAINNDRFDEAVRRIADLDLRLMEKEQDLQLVKSNLDKTTQTLVIAEKELGDRNTQLTQAKQLLTKLGRSLPNPAKQVASNKNASPKEPVAAARATTDLARASKKLTSALKKELKRGSVVMEQHDDKLTLALASGEVFGIGQATLTSAGTSLVKRIGLALREFTPQSIEVAGHTDNIPVRYNKRRPFRDNNELSQARADHAGQVLIKAGLDADRIRTVGYADNQPIATNNTEAGRSKNRRVEIIVTQSSEPVAS